MRLRIKTKLLFRRWWKRVQESRIYKWFGEPRHLWIRFRMWRRKRRINKSLRILDALDWHMGKAGWTRQQRKQFWRDFIKKQEFRTGALNQLTQQ